MPWRYGARWITRRSRNRRGIRSSLCWTWRTAATARLAATSRAGKAFLWDIPHRAPLPDLPSNFSSQVQAVAFSPEDSLVAAAGGPGQVIVWNVADKTQRFKPLRGGHDLINDIAFSPDSMRLAVAGATPRAVAASRTPENPLMVLWDLSQKKPSATSIRPTGMQKMRVLFTSDGKTLVSGDLDGRVVLWDLTRQPPSAEVLPVQQGWLGLHVLAISADGGLLAAGGTQGVSRFWGMANRRVSGEPLRVPQDRTIQSMAFSRDGKTIATADDSGAVIHWDMTTRAQVSAPLAGHQAAVSSIAFSPSGK